MQNPAKTCSKRHPIETHYYHSGNILLFDWLPIMRPATLRTCV